MKNRPQSNKGFTLLEIIAVLVIAAIAALVVANVASRGRSNLAGRTEALKSHIRYAQSMAMSTDNRNWGIRFYTGADSYWLFYCETGQNCNWDANITSIPGTDSNQSRILLGEEGINITDINPVDNPVTLAFDNFGTPFTGGKNTVLETILASDLIITLQDQAGRSENISVTPTTGFVL